MALQNKDLGGDVRQFAGFPRMHVEQNKAVKIAAITGGPTLALATPIMETGTTGTYAVWATGSPIVGFIAHQAHKSSAAGETLAVVMLEGEIHAADVVLPSGQTQANLDAALKASTLRTRGIHVQGLEDVSV